MEIKLKNRSRITYGVFIILVILLGLGSRKFSNALPKWIGAYAGDILWALMVFLGIGFIFKSLSTLKVGFLATVFSFAIEISQLYHSQWIDGVRKTPLGGLVLGFGFLWSDLVCYIIGVSIGMVMERYIRKKTPSSHIPML